MEAFRERKGEEITVVARRKGREEEENRREFS